MICCSLAGLLLAAVAIAVPLDERQSSAPTATIRNGTVIGSSSGGVDSFNGIPFALPPLGNLRLKPPQPITKTFGTFSATAAAKACPQFFSQVDSADLPSDVLGELLDSPLGQVALNQNEDCLTITIQRPAGTTSQSKLPVLFWIFGGGFELGSSAMYNGSGLVSASVNLSNPIIYVAVNYRVGGFGFLGGKLLAAEHSTNLGLRDQRAGLQWVQENIAAFGGDPNKVTIFGESAGSISVMDHTIINRGDNTYNGRPLFRGAIMDSGTLVPTVPVTSGKAQAIFDKVATSAGCANAADILACLRGLSYTNFQRAVNSVPGIFSYRSLDLSYLPRPDPGDSFFSESPEVSVMNGRFAKVPVIVGDQEDEGTLFSLVQSNVTNNAQLATYLASYFPDNPNALADVTGLLAYYPDEPLLGQPSGSPFRTGGFNNIYPQFKRIAAVLGDIVFTLTRRGYLHFIADQTPAWSYLSSYSYGTAVLGTFHGSDILQIFSTDAANSSVPRQSILQYYISFVNELDPNALGTQAPLIPWPRWSNVSSNPQILNFQKSNNTLIGDTFRSGAFNYLIPRVSKFRA